MVEMTPSFNCIRCGEPFLRGRLGRPAVFCGRTCRQRYHEQKRLFAELEFELHRSLLREAFQRGLLLPLISAARGDSSHSENAKAPDPRAEG